MTAPIFDIMHSFFEQDNWNAQKIASKTILKMGFQGNHGQWQCFAEAREAKKQFLFYSILLFQVPPPQRPAIAEFLTRANYGITLGNFEMDFDDGEIRYKTTLSTKHTPLTPAMVKQQVYLNVQMMDTYLPGILAVLENGIAPAEAILQVE